MDAEKMREPAPRDRTASRDSAGQKCLIVASGDSATGAARAAGIADRVMCAGQELVWGPAPVQDDPPAFLASRLAAWDIDLDTSDQPESWMRDPATNALAKPTGWEHGLGLFRQYERIELWMDPGPNAQLQLIQLLDWLGRDERRAGKVLLMQGVEPLGECRSEDIRALRPRVEPLEPRAFELATWAWSAFRRPTPEAWRALLSSNLTALPRLAYAVGALLAELPSARTGLRATERRLLERVAEDGATWLSVMPWMLRLDDRQVFGYWELGRLLDGLARGPGAAITGLPAGPFNLALHEDSARWRQYNHSPLRLTPLGEALLREDEDLSRHRPVRFWWGGTLLRPECLWRWDETTGSLSR